MQIVAVKSQTESREYDYLLCHFRFKPNIQCHPSPPTHSDIHERRAIAMIYCHIF